MVWQVLFRNTNPFKCYGTSYSDTPIRPNVVASPVQKHQSVQMLWHVLFRYTNPSKCCGKSCSETLIRPNVVASPVQIHQSVQMLWQVLFGYTNPSKCCGKSCSDTPHRPSVVTSSLLKRLCSRTSEPVSHLFIQSSNENGTQTHSNHNGLTLPHTT